MDMDTFFIAFVVLAVLGIGGTVVFWLVTLMAAGKAMVDHSADMERLMRQVQGAMQSPGGGAGQDPQLRATWAQMQNLMGSMNRSDQMRYEETMGSMRADAASMGLFLD